MYDTEKKKSPLVGREDGILKYYNIMHIHSSSIEVFPHDTQYKCHTQGWKGILLGQGLTMGQGLIIKQFWLRTFTLVVLPSGYEVQRILLEPVII